MITVPEIVKDIVKRSPFMEEALARDIINLSSLARNIKPEIENRLFKKVEQGSIVMALKRLSSSLNKTQKEPSSASSQNSDITLRSNLVEFTFANSATLIDKQRKLLSLHTDQKSNFMTFTQGVFETTIFVNQSLAESVENIFKNEHLIHKFEGLSSITLIIPEEATQTPGVYYSVLKKLAWEGINFIESVSSFTELTIFLEEKEVDKAFSALKNLN